MQPLRKIIWEFAFEKLMLILIMMIIITCNYYMNQQFYSWAFIPEKRKLCLHKNLHMNIYNSFIFNSQNLKPTQMSFDRWMVNTLWYIHAIKKSSCYVVSCIPPTIICRSPKSQYLRMNPYLEIVPLKKWVK